jgi:predicted GNAT superfamily acetyltransferase
MSRTARTAQDGALPSQAHPAALAVARRAEQAAGVRIETLDAPDALREAAEMWHRIWERTGEPPVSADMLRALTHAGNYLSGAFQNGRMVGALLGFYGGTDHPDHLHSHILGVDPALRTRGIAFALKLHQRAWALEREIDTITWTFDPLVRANAYLNVGKLGATGAEYLVNFYGAMPDTINGDDESDRILVRWKIAEARVDRVVGSAADEVVAPSAEVALEVGPDEEPVARPVVAGSPLRCQVPADIISVRRADPGLAREWRMALREALVPAFRRGLTVTGMERSGWYLLS